MPRASTDWKKEAQKEIVLHGPSPGLRGRVILEAGTRRSLANTPLPEQPMTRGRMLGLMEEQLRRRLARRRNPKKPKLKGLFGGGE